MMTIPSLPIARGPLLDAHRRAQATVAIVDGWEVATHYPGEPRPDETVIADVSNHATWEIGGPQTGRILTEQFGVDVPLRRLHVADARVACRLTPVRAIVFGHLPASVPEAIDVTGGWASVRICGPDAARVLAKVTAVDLREQTLPVHGCCQAPVFGVNTLFCRFPDRWELHVCPDSMEFFWEVLLDAGSEYKLRSVGWAVPTSI